MPRSASSPKSIIYPRSLRASLLCPQVLALNSIALQTVSHYKYLGVHLSPNLSWNINIDKTISLSNQFGSYIRRNFTSVSSHLKRFLHTTLVRPKLGYALSIWHPHKSGLTNAIQAVRNRAASFCSFRPLHLSSVIAMNHN